MNEEIEITFLEDDDLPQHPPILPRNSYKEWYSPRNAGVRIICSHNIFETVERFSKENSRTVVGGVLLGAAYRHNGDIYVEVTEYIKARVSSGGQSGISHFTFTDQTWADMLAVKDRQHADLRIVGWFHSHPGHTAFLSQMDLDIHGGHFKSPWHIAMVYDPINHEGGFFVWEKGKIILAPGFYERFEPGQKSKLTWKKPSRRATPSPAPASSSGWKDPMEWLWGMMLVCVLAGLLIGYQGIKNIHDALILEQGRITQLEQTIVAMEKKFPTATPTFTMTPTATPTLTNTPTPTETPSPTVTIITDTITPTFTLTGSPVSTSTVPPTQTPDLIAATKTP